MAHNLKFGFNNLQQKQTITFFFFITSILTIKAQGIKSIENIIINKEKSNLHVKPNNQAKIIWSKNYKQQQLPIAFVYLHGFGANNREGEPIMSKLSEKHNANVYMSCLKEHGLNRTHNFKNLIPENYIASAKEALAIGKNHW